MTRSLILTALIFLVFASTAEAKRPWLPIAIAQAETLTWESLFADWRTREQASITGWTRELAPPSCLRARRNVVICEAKMTITDRSGTTETATWTMRVRRYRDDFVRGGLVTLSYLVAAAEWTDVPITVHEVAVGHRESPA